jgi:enoyl-CoA hydratase
VSVEGHALVVVLDRPGVKNALNAETANAVAAALDRLDANPGLRVGVLTGAAGNFSSGMDLKAFGATGERPQVPGRGLVGLTTAPPKKPLIAAVEGYALAGGFEVVLACDLVVASETANFGIPEVKRGLIAGSGGLIRLPRRIPINVAMEYALTGRQMTAAEAFRWGLVNHLSPPGHALDRALALAEEIAQNSPMAVQLTKQVVLESGDWPADERWGRQQEVLATVLGSADAQEGTAAFVEKRAPIWRDT